MLGPVLLSLTLMAAPERSGCDRFSAVEGVGVVRDSSCDAPAVQPGDSLTVDSGGFAGVRDGAGREVVCVNRGAHALRLIVDDEGGLKPASCKRRSCKATVKLMRCHEVERPAELDAAPSSALDAASSSPPPTSAAAPTPASPTTPSADAPVQLLVSAFEATDVPAGTVEILSTLVAVELARRDGLSVVTGDELRDLIAQAGAAEAKQCSEEAGACLAEVAGALGARFLVSGRVAKAGRLLVISVSLYDTEAAAAVARVQFEAQNVVAARASLPRAVDNLLAPITGEPPVEIPPAPLVRAAEDASSIGGGALAAVGTAAGALACVGGPAAGCVALVASAPPALVPTLFAVAALLPILPCSLCVCGPTALGAAAGDAFFGFDINWWRAFAAGAAGALVMAVGAFVALVIAQLSAFFVPAAFALAAGRTELVDEEFRSIGLVAVAIALAAAGVGATVAASTAAGLMFDVGVVLFEPAPDPLELPEGEGVTRAWPSEVAPPPVRRLVSSAPERPMSQRY